MGFYSQICLATSNKKVKVKKILDVLYDEKIIVNQFNATEYESCQELWGQFENSDYKRSNPQLCIPGCISVYDDYVECGSSDEGQLQIKSASIVFHGPGSLYPITMDDLANGFFKSDIMVKLENRLMELYPGCLMYSGSNQELFKTNTYTKSNSHWTYVYVRD